MEDKGVGSGGTASKWERKAVLRREHSNYGGELVSVLAMVVTMGCEITVTSPPPLITHGSALSRTCQETLTGRGQQ